MNGTKIPQFGKNTSYLNDIYNTMKQSYIKQAKKNSLVLVYDWNTEGETELVIEDIERLNFDWYEQHDEQQTDWRLFQEDQYEKQRKLYTHPRYLTNLLDFAISDDVEAEHYFWTPEENLNISHVMGHIPSDFFEPGFNPYNGENPLFKINGDDHISFGNSGYSKFWSPSAHGFGLFPEALESVKKNN